MLKQLDKLNLLTGTRASSVTLRPESFFSGWQSTEQKAGEICTNRVLWVKIDQDGRTYRSDLGWDAVMYSAACEWVAGSCKIRENPEGKVSSCPLLGLVPPTWKRLPSGIRQHLLSKSLLLNGFTPQSVLQPLLPLSLLTFRRLGKLQPLVTEGNCPVSITLPECLFSVLARLLGSSEILSFKKNILINSLQIWYNVVW